MLRNAAFCIHSPRESRCARARAAGYAQQVPGRDKEPNVCPLCNREVGELSDHHLVPKSRGGRQTEPICVSCHRMIHVLYDNKTLAKELASVAALIAEPKFAKYLAWIGKRPDRRFSARRPGRRRRR
jgi:hypothetical protein